MPPAIFLEKQLQFPDSVNSIKWDTLEDETYQNVYNYYKGLIAFRKAHAALRLYQCETMSAQTSLPMRRSRRKCACIPDQRRCVNGETSDGIFVIFNPNSTEHQKAFVKCVDIILLTQILSLLLPE